MYRSRMRTIKSPLHKNLVIEARAESRDVATMEVTLHNERSNSTVFEELLVKSGLKLGQPGHPLLSVDQAVFQRNLYVALKSHNNYPQVVREFFTEFIDMIDDQRNLWIWLNPTKTEQVNSNIRGAVQRSLIRLLMGNTDLQPRIIRLLLEKLVEIRSKEGDEDETSMFENEFNAKQIPKLILFQFRQLDVVEDSKGFIDTILEIFDCIALEDQKEIIAMMPEILEDGQHETIAAYWKELLQTRRDLTLVILDSLLIMHISDETLDNIKQTVLKGMDAACMDDLPMIVKFLTQSVTAADAIEILSELKEKFNFSLPTQQQKSEIQGKQSIEVLMMESLRSSIQFRQIVGDTFVKLFDGELTETKKWTAADLLVALVLLSVSARKKTMETIIFKALRKGTLSKSVVKTCLKRFPQICDDYYLMIIDLAKTSISSHDTVIQQFGQLLYEMMFSTSDNLGILQGVVESVCKQAHQEQTNEKDAALDILQRFIVKEPKKMGRFGVFLKGFLDYIGIYDLPSVRKIYAILGSQSQSLNSNNRDLLDDFHIVVRKQLSNSSPMFRRMGIIGAIALMKTSLPKDSLESLSTSEIQEACNLLETAEKFMTKDPEALALFYDELSTAVKQNEIHPLLLNWISDRVTGDFENQFVVDVEEGRLAKEPTVCGQLMFALDKEADIGVALDLLSCTHDGSAATRNSKRAMVYLPSQFRLLTMCELVAHSNNLEGIDALLGCPIHFVSKGSLENFFRISAVEKKLVCQCCFGLINWCIELVNTFVTQTDSDMEFKVLARLRLIVEIRANLMDFLSVMGGFCPPLAHFDGPDNEEIRVPCAPSKKKTNAKLKNKGGCKPVTMDETADDQGSLNETVKTPPKKRKRNSNNDDSESQSADVKKDDSSKKADPVDLNLFRLCFRELDVGVFRILKYQLILKSDENVPDLHLKMDELHFLLKDLRLKLEISLQSMDTQTKRGFLFGKAKSSDRTSLHRNLLLMGADKFIEYAVKLLPSIRGHLDVVTAYFHADSVSDNDDDETSFIGVPIICRNSLSDVLQHLLDIIKMIFSWNEFSSSGNQSLLNEALEEFSPKITTGATLKNAFSYFCEKMETCPNFCCATRLVDLLDTLVTKGTDSTLNNSLADVTLILLKRDWKRSARTSNDRIVKDSDLYSVLRLYFKSCHSKLDALEMFATKAIPELLAADDDFAPTYPTLTRSTIPVYYRILMEELLAMIKMKCAEEGESDEEVLLLWNISLKIFNILVNLIKEYSSNKIISLCLKHGRLFVELFIKNGMPLMDRTFQRHVEDVKNVLQTLQLSTRYLQHVCSHSKVSKAVGVTAYVPPLRKVLEELIFRVKAMLAINNCKKAFWVGNLKNRTLQGQEILTQESNTSREGDESGNTISVRKDSESEGEDEASDEAENMSECY